MNVLFLSLLSFDTLDEENIYTDLLKEFSNRGDNVYVVSPIERQFKKSTYIIEEKNVKILRLKIGNIQKTNIIEKGISTVILEYQIIKGIKKYFNNIKFDLVLYSTPPITFYKAIKYIKNRDKAISYLMLKDIFPQNAVDIGILSQSGIKSIIYKYFRKKEKKLYYISDYIGCMSEANVKYIIQHNKELNENKIEICPNSINVKDKSIDENIRKQIREKYSIPYNKKIFIYGGNLGRPQGIDFIIECLEYEKDNNDIFFIIVGDGTEFKKIFQYINNHNLNNVKLMNKVSKDEYDKLVAASDIGLIFLDYRFTIPNFPSRLLNYMQAKLPVIAATDLNSDIGIEIEKGKFGWSCNSNNVVDFDKCIQKALKNQLDREDEWKYLEENFSTSKCYKIIKEKVKNENIND
jgi:hypothetical protein